MPNRMEVFVAKSCELAALALAVGDDRLRAQVAGERGPRGARRAMRRGCLRRTARAAGGARGGGQPRPADSGGQYSSLLTPRAQLRSFPRRKRLPLDVVALQDLALRE